MSYVSNQMIWAEMARRKAQFHSNEKWDTIRLWGLFQWQYIGRLIRSGKLLTDMKKENQTLWVRPTKETWETKIKPLIDKHSLDELSKMTGW